MTEEFAESLEKLCEALQLAESDACEAAKLATPVAGISVARLLAAISQVRGEAMTLARAVNHEGAA